MLQITSGKLFAQEPGQRNELRGVVYTNLFLYENPIETAAGRLLPTNTLRAKSSLVYELTELIESPPGSGGVVSHGIDPYLNDFAAIVSFALNVTCTPDSELTSRLTSDRLGPVLSVPPRKLIRRVFDDLVFCQDKDTAKLVKIVSDLIGLQRKSYLAAMRAIRTYVTGLHRLADDLELAYTLLVASIESLTQGFDGHRAEWADYEESKRKAIDEALANADNKTTEAVREAILNIEHVSLARRFRAFTLEHLQPSFFREEAVDLDNPVGRAELPRALYESYRLRSNYIHELKELPKALTLGASYTETTRINRVTYLTFQGMIRLVRHVITEFIRRQPKVEKEVYDYSSELTGIVKLPLAAQYWVGNPEGLTNSSGWKYLEGFLGQIAEYFQQEPDTSITDMRKVLIKVEKMLPNMNAVHRRPFLALYLIFNKLVSPDIQMKNFNKIQTRYGDELDIPSVEAMLVYLVLGVIPDEWPLSDHEQVHDDYFRRQGKKNGLKVRRNLEAGLSLALAERYRTTGDAKRAHELVTYAVENYPGHAPLRELEQAFDLSKAIDWHGVIFPAREATDTEGAGSGE